MTHEAHGIKVPLTYQTKEALCCKSGLGLDAVGFSLASGTAWLTSSLYRYASGSEKSDVFMLAADEGRYTSSKYDFVRLAS